MPFVLLLLDASLPRLFGSLVVVQNYKQPLHAADEAVPGNTVGGHQLFSSGGAVLVDGLNKT